MSIDLKHVYVSPTSDNAAKEVSSGEWNALHNITLAGDNLVGSIAGGAAVEIPCTAAGRALLDDADAAAQRTTVAAEPYANVGLTFSVSSNALTIALKTAAGSDASASSPVYIKFRDATASSAVTTTLAVTAAASLVISSGSTLGTANATAFRVWVVAFNDAGTMRLGAMMTRLSSSSFWQVHALRGWNIASSTAEGGAGGADTAQVFYTGTAVSAKAYTFLGWASWETGLTTAGTWNAGPTRVHVWQPGDPLPGDRIAYSRFLGSAASSSASTTYVATGAGVPITLSSAANLVDVAVSCSHYSSNAEAAYMRLCRNSVTNMVGTESEVFGAAGGGTACGGVLSARDLPNTTSATNYLISVKHSTGSANSFLRAFMYELNAVEVMT